MRERPATHYSYMLLNYGDMSPSECFLSWHALFICNHHKECDSIARKVNNLNCGNSTFERLVCRSREMTDEYHHRDLALGSGPKIAPSPALQHRAPQAATSCLAALAWRHLHVKRPTLTNATSFEMTACISLGGSTPIFASEASTAVPSLEAKGLPSGRASGSGSIARGSPRSLTLDLGVSPP